MRISPLISVLCLIVLVLILTILTQVGGIVLLIALLIGLFFKKYVLLKTSLVFSSVYLVVTFFLIPFVAPKFGRVKIQENDQLNLVSNLYVLCNRNYVVPELHDLLQELGEELAAEKIQVNILDANFPFIDGFPLLPHRSHNDGRKVDLSLVYEASDGQYSNAVMSRSGYGVFESPKEAEIKQYEICFEKGNTYYDLAKYIKLGMVNEQLMFSEKGTKILINKLTSSNIGKLFVEPHLKQRLRLNHSKIRFQGCKATRHDDHIHIQL